MTFGDRRANSDSISGNHTLVFLDMVQKVSSPPARGARKMRGADT
jgi:hypothetical protein